MSALARYFNSEGYFVCGYDRTSYPITDQLNQEGIGVFFEDHLSSIDNKFIQNSDECFIVYTPAIPQSSYLMNYFLKNDYAMYKRAEILGEVTKNTINLSVAGTHG